MLKSTPLREEFNFSVNTNIFYKLFFTLINNPNVVKFSDVKFFKFLLQVSSNICTRRKEGCGIDGSISTSGNDFNSCLKADKLLCKS